MYFQKSSTILNAYTKKVCNLIEDTSCVCLRKCTRIYTCLYTWSHTKNSRTGTHTHTHTHTHIYIYIYIYIYCHPLTDRFVLSELFSVARHVRRSKPGSKPIQLYVRVSLRPFGQQAYQVWLRELLRYLSSNSSSRLFTFLYPIGYQSAEFFWRALHYASGDRKFLHQSARVQLYIYIYIYIWNID